MLTHIRTLRPRSDPTDDRSAFLVSALGCFALLAVLLVAHVLS